MSDHCQGCRDPEDPRRRSVLRLLGMTAGAVVAAGCGGQEQGPPVLRVALRELPEGQPVEAYVGSEPVELLRSGESVTSRSLWCTHMGCKVVREGEAGYYCPCHDGRFDAAGQPAGGPPKEPLRTMQVTVEGEFVIVEQGAV